MGNTRKLYLLPAVLLILALNACQHVSTLAQAAANNDIIDRDTANIISLSAMAFVSAAEDITPEQEYYIGRSVAAQILTVYKIWDEDPEFTTYLNLICNAIVLNSPKPELYNGYHVAILDSDEINAFATSGGHIFVTRGLINIAKSEDALAGVLAHEIAHVQLKHSIRSIKTSRITKALLLTASAGAVTVKGIDVDELVDILNESVGEIIQTMVNSGYSREQEYEADRAAMYLMSYAGYHPSGMIDMLQDLKSSHTAGRGFGRTHPAPIQRIYYAARILERFSVGRYKYVRWERFKNEINRFRSIHDELIIAGDTY